MCQRGWPQAPTSDIPTGHLSVGRGPRETGTWVGGSEKQVAVPGFQAPSSPGPG